MRFLPIPALALLCGLALTGCGGTGSDQDRSGGPASSPAAADTAALKFAKCMREHGVDMPDPKPGENGISVRNSPGMAKAMEACKQFTPNGGKPKEQTKEELDAAVKRAQCLRKHGLNVPDPKPGEAIGLPGDPDEQKVKKAVQSCR